VKDVRVEDPKLRQIRFKELELGVKDIPAAFLLLDSPMVNTYENLYGPVKFMHSKHAASLDGNCALCHHASPAGADAAKDRLSETVACRACHQESFDPKRPERIGLKAAYHQQCMDCHTKMHKGPVDCAGCHSKNVPNHKDLVKLPADPTPMQVTQECLRCHQKAGEDMIESAHWLWKGPSPFTVEKTKRVMSGKATDTINNFCIALPSNWPRCTSCHAGYGWKDETFDFTDTSRIDCLSCHDTTGSYAKTPTAAGMPAPEVDLVHVAQNVGLSSRTTCGNCHFERVRFLVLGLPSDPEPQDPRPQHLAAGRRGLAKLRGLPLPETALRRHHARLPPQQAYRYCGLQHVPFPGLFEVRGDKDLVGLVGGRRQGAQARQRQVRHA
jgi:hypothetical protein